MAGDAPAEPRPLPRLVHLLLLRSRSARALALVLLAVDLLVGGAAALSIRSTKREALELGERTTRNLSEALGAGLDGTLAQVELLLLAAEDRLRTHGNARNDAALERDLARIASRLPLLDAIRAATAAGKVDRGVGVLPGTSYDITDRDYFQRAQATDRLVASAPLVSRVNGKRVVMLAKRIPRDGGSFGGLVYGAVTVDELTRALGRVALPWNGRVVLRDQDTSVVAIFPPLPAGAAPGQGGRALSPELAALLASGRSDGTVMASSSPIDGAAKLVAYRRIGGGAFHLLVSADVDALLADWRARSRRTVGATGLFVLLTVAGAWLLARLWEREAQARARAAVNEEQAELIARLQQALGEVKTLSGLLPICAHCKRIRDDKGYWNRIETYLRERSGAQFSHGICPECMDQHYGDFK